MNRPDPDQARMSLGDHLDDLRRRLILGLLGPFVCVIAMFFFGRQAIALMTLPLTVALADEGLPPQVYFSNPIQSFTIYLKVCLVLGLIIGLPWLMWHLWKFVEAGLYPKERRFVLGLVPGSALLTFIGVGFMYFVVLPLTLLFFIMFAASYGDPLTESPWMNFVIGREAAEVAPDAADPQAAPFVIPVLPEHPTTPQAGQMWIKVPENRLQVFVNDRTYSAMLTSSGLLSPLTNLADYISFVIWLALAFALAFQLPIVMLLLSGTGLVSHEQMRSVRRYAVLGCFIVGALLTPADVLSQIFLALPMWGLYEIGLILVKMTARRRQAEA